MTDSDSSSSSSSPPESGFYFSPSKREALRQFAEEYKNSVRQAAVDADASRLATRSANVVAAYNKLQGALEARRQTRPRSSKPSATKARAYRIEDLGLVSARSYLLYASEDGAQVLAGTALKGDGGVEEAEAFGKRFYEKVIVTLTTCRATPAPTPGGSSASSMEEPESEEGADDPAVTRRESQSVLRQRLLRIHCGRCVVTGDFARAWEPLTAPPIPEYLLDSHFVMLHEHCTKTSSLEIPYAGLIASHILRFALGENTSRLDATWDLLQKFIGKKDLSVYRNGIQATKNAVLLSNSAAAAFKTLDLWIDPDPEAFDRKNVNDPFSCTVHSNDGQAWHERITFSNYYHDSGQRRSGYDLPDPELLRLHANLGRMMAASGMTEYVQELWREREEVDDLLSEGRSPTDVEGWGADVARALRSVDTGD